MNKPIVPVQRNIILPEVKSENNKKSGEQPKENQNGKNPVPEKNNGKGMNAMPTNPQQMDLNPMNSNDPALQNMMPPTPDLPKKP